MLFLSRPDELRIEVWIVSQFVPWFNIRHRLNVVVYLVGRQRRIGFRGHQSNGGIIDALFVLVLVAVYGSFFRGGVSGVFSLTSGHGTFQRLKKSERGRDGLTLPSTEPPEQESRFTLLSCSRTLKFSCLNSKRSGPNVTYAPIRASVHRF